MLYSITSRRRFAAGAAVAVGFALLTAGGCAKPVDEGEAAYKGPGPAKAGAPGASAAGSTVTAKPAAPAASTGAQRRPQ